MYEHGLSENAVPENERRNRQLNCAIEAVSRGVGLHVFQRT